MPHLLMINLNYFSRWQEIWYYCNVSLTEFSFSADNTPLLPYELLANKQSCTVKFLPLALKWVLLAQNACKRQFTSSFIWKGKSCFWEFKFLSCSLNLLSNRGTKKRLSDIPNYAQTWLTHTKGILCWWLNLWSCAPNDLRTLARLEVSLKEYSTRNNAAMESIITSFIVPLFSKTGKRCEMIFLMSSCIRLE